MILETSTSQHRFSNNWYCEPYPVGSACKLTSLCHKYNMSKQCSDQGYTNLPKSLGATCKFCTPKGWYAGSSTTILGATIQNVSFLIILCLYWKIVFDGRVFNVKNKYCENNNVFLVIFADRRRIRQRSVAHCSAGSQDVQRAIAR